MKKKLLMTEKTTEKNLLKFVDFVLPNRRSNFYGPKKLISYNKVSVDPATISKPVMQISRFSANFADFISKFVIFVNRVSPLRIVGGAF